MACPCKSWLPPKIHHRTHPYIEIVTGQRRKNVSYIIKSNIGMEPFGMQFSVPSKVEI